MDCTYVVLFSTFTVLIHPHTHYTTVCNVLNIILQLWYKTNTQSDVDHLLKYIYVWKGSKLLLYSRCFVLMFVKAGHAITGIHLWHAAHIVLLIEQLGGQFCIIIISQLCTFCDSLSECCRLLPNPVVRKKPIQTVTFPAVIPSLLFQSAWGVPARLMLLLSAPCSPLPSAV